MSPVWLGPVGNPHHARINPAAAAAAGTLLQQPQHRGPPPPGVRYIPHGRPPPGAAAPRMPPPHPVHHAAVIAAGGRRYAPPPHLRGVAPPPHVRAGPPPPRPGVPVVIHHHGPPPPPHAAVKMPLPPGAINGRLPPLPQQRVVGPPPGHGHPQHELVYTGAPRPAPVIRVSSSPNGTQQHVVVMKNGVPVRAPVPPPHMRPPPPHVLRRPGTGPPASQAPSTAAAPVSAAVQQAPQQTPLGESSRVLNTKPPSPPTAATTAVVTPKSVPQAKVPTLSAQQAADTDTTKTTAPASATAKDTARKKEEGMQDVASILLGLRTSPPTVEESAAAAAAASTSSAENKDAENKNPVSTQVAASTSTSSEVEMPAPPPQRPHPPVQVPPHMARPGLATTTLIGHKRPPPAMVVRRPVGPPPMPHHLAAARPRSEPLSVPSYFNRAQCYSTNNSYYGEYDSPPVKKRKKRKVVTANSPASPFFSAPPYCKPDTPGRKGAEAAVEDKQEAGETSCSSSSESSDETKTQDSTTTTTSSPTAAIEATTKKASSASPNDKANKDNDTIKQPDLAIVSSQSEDSGATVAFPTRLALPEDNSKLNAMHCFLRRELLEVFVLNDDYNVPVIPHDSDDNASTSSPPEALASDRVGLRCVHCARARSYKCDPKFEAPMAVFYPKTVSELYRLITSWQRVHLRKCRHLPPNIRERYLRIREADKSRGKTQYWITSAKKLGLVDSEKEGGIRFSPEAAMREL